MINFIKSLFNISEDSIERFDTYTQDSELIVNIRLKKINESKFCSVCGKKLVANETKSKPINHNILTDRRCRVNYEARRYRYKKCNYTEFERNPFAMNRFLLILKTHDNLKNNFK